MGGESLNKCSICDRIVKYGPGMMLVESHESKITDFYHEECYQMSGEDEGYVQRIYEILDERDELCD
jgi:hypothetical protein